MATVAEKPAGAELERRLGLASATAVVAGEVIAAGIFLTPAAMAKSVGSPFWLLVIWLVVTGMTLSGALCYGELAGRFPRPGGTYVYLHETLGSRVAFLYGWMCLLVLDPGLTAALATGTAAYAAYIFQWTSPVIKLAAVILILALCLMNILSIRVSAGFLRWVTWLKLGVLGVLVVWAFAFHLGMWGNFSPFVAQRAGSLPLGSALGAGMVAAFFSFGGWWDVSKMAGEVRDPARTLPRAMALGVVIVAAVYILVSAVFVYLIPLDKVTSNDAFVAQAGEILFGKAGGVALAAHRRRLRCRRLGGVCAECSASLLRHGAGWVVCSGRSEVASAIWNSDECDFDSSRRLRQRSCCWDRSSRYSVILFSARWCF
jgi:basic amino acid/polyamine antiporter, APA family